MSNLDLSTVLEQVKQLKVVTRARQGLQDPAICDDIFSAIKQLARSSKLHHTEDKRVSTGKSWDGPKETSYKRIADGKRAEQVVQRAFLATSKQVTINRSSYQLIDAEVPTRPGSGGIDLLGIPTTGDILRRAIIELKFAKSNRAARGDSPVAALLQGVAYAQDARIHARVLCTHTTRKEEAGDLKFPTGWTPSVIVAANRGYWKYWLDRLGPDATNQLQTLASRVVTSKLAQEALFVSFEDFNHPRLGSPGRLSLEATASHCNWASVI